MNTKSPRLAALALAAVLTASGCGTVGNFASRKPTVYGGVERDVRYFSRNDAHFHLPAGESGGGWDGAAKLGFYLAIIPAEFCCTFLADTLTLPITMMLDPDWSPPKEDRAAEPDVGPPAALLPPPKPTP